MHIGEYERALLKAHTFTKAMVLTEEPNFYFLEGDFSFSAIYDEERKGYFLDPPESHHGNPNYIRDTYNLRICIPKRDTPDHNFFKGVSEMGGRIESVAKKYQRPNDDLHLNSDGTLCIIGLNQETESMSLQDFIEGPLLQFFYDQTFFDTHGQIWPRGEFSHGILGIFESFYESLVDERPDEAEVYRTLLYFKQKLILHYVQLLGFIKKHPVPKGHWPLSKVANSIGFSTDDGLIRLRKYKGGRAFRGLYAFSRAVHELGLLDLQLTYEDKRRLSDLINKVKHEEYRPSPKLIGLNRRYSGKAWPLPA